MIRRRSGYDFWPLLLWLALVGVLVVSAAALYCAFYAFCSLFF